MPKRKRTYNTRLIKATWVYSVQEVAALFKLHKNAVLRWIKEGLAPIDGGKPYLIRGNILKTFLDNRQQCRKRKCGFDQFYCVKCRSPKAASLGMVDVIVTSSSKLRLKAICETCETPLNKIQAVKRLPEIERTFHVQKLEGRHLLERIKPSVNRDMEPEDETPAN